MPDGSVYHGEVAYVDKDTSNLYYNLDEVHEDLKPKLKIVRHGYGIQLFGRNENNMLC